MAWTGQKKGATGVAPFVRRRQAAGAWLMAPSQGTELAEEAGGSGAEA